MTQVILYIIIASTASIALIKPWMGIVACYTIIILNPQAIWWWQFEGIRLYFIIFLFTFFGFIISNFNSKINYTTIFNKKNFWLLVLWTSFAISYFFGPYVDILIEGKHFDPFSTLLIVNNIFILYFIACICIDNEKKTEILAWIIVISTIYMIYWINDQYLFQGRYGRIGGPSPPGQNTIYRDENAFAMLFVVGLPFLYYFGFTCRSKLLRYGMWITVPLGWHAIFLTGSRGGLLGLAVTLIVILIRSKIKLYGLIIILVAIFFYHWQAGPVMQQRAQTINEFREDGSAVGRLDAWSAAIEMVKNYPLTGVGISSFVTSFSHFSNKKPREAHNSFFQILGEQGIVGGIAYIMIIFFTIKNIFYNSKLLSKSNVNNYDLKKLFYINEALLASFIGLIVCSMFISLQIYEIFYFLCLISNSIKFISENKNF